MLKVAKCLLLSESEICLSCVLYLDKLINEKLIKEKLKKIEIIQVILNKIKLQNSLFENVFSLRYIQRRNFIFFVICLLYVLIHDLFIPIFLLQFLKLDLI